MSEPCDLCPIRYRRYSQERDRRRVANGTFMAAIAGVIVHAGIPARFAATGRLFAYERIAFGAGATSFFRCTTLDDLDALERLLLPGSIVTFMFDGVHELLDAAQGKVDIGRLINDELGALLGIYTGVTEMHRVDVLDVSEIDEEMANHPGARFFYASYPGRDDDAGNVTVTIPDEDGIVRPHPH